MVGYLDAPHQREGRLQAVCIGVQHSTELIFGHKLTPVSSVIVPVSANVFAAHSVIILLYGICIFFQVM